MTAYRYTLDRTTCILGATDTPVIVMLNPSTADETTDDPTIRRLKGFAMRERWKGFRVVNLFAARATNPQELCAVDHPAGPENDRTIAESLAHRSLVIAAWGARPSTYVFGIAYDWRVGVVRALAAGLGIKLHCFGVTKAGDPRHPLYVRGDAQIVPWQAAVRA